MATKKKLNKADFMFKSK